MKTIKEYYNANKSGIKMGGAIYAPSIGQSGATLQWIVSESDGPAVIAHMAASGITNVRTMTKSGRMAIEAR